MEKGRGTQTVIIAVLAVALLAMSIGFAASAYTQNLDISGNTVNVKASKWDVHFKTGADDYTESVGSVAATNHSVTGTTMEYTISLVNPGDFYEATITAENLGTFDANLVGLTLAGLTETQKNYVKYTVSYNGTEYTESNAAINGVTLAKTNGTAPVKVRVEYVQPNDASLLPAEDQTINLTTTLTYNQAQ